MVFLQTWHGTPLKTIAYDNKYVIANPAGFVRDVHEYRRWDYVISPNAFSTEILRRAFRGFAGEMLETGYPRNDVLNAPDRDEVRARVRAALGVEDGQTVVLYAPTWRDNLYHEQGPHAYTLALDLDALGRALGEEHVILLRLHFLVAANIGDTAGAAVRNVSEYPDIRDLYLAADVMITDYSSAMFDWAVTGKPIVFYTYDLEHYRDEMRGFYFDFEPAAPGPLCRTTDEVISVMTDRDAALAPYAERYARFRERFCHWDDGHASARVVERVFADLLA
jgi:CDP-glycerol glycerophosphotransferase